ncbi:hypothetical protein ACFL2D_01500, partial [Patescibacteria group bacterium]
MRHKKSQILPIVGVASLVASYIAPVVFSILALATPVQEGEAAFIQDDSTGFFHVSFQNQQGWELDVDKGGKGQDSLGDPLTVNTETLGFSTLTVDSTFPTVTTPPNQSYFTTSLITPSSFEAWDEIILDATYATIGDVTVSLYDCDDPPVPIPAFQNVMPAANRVDISSLDPDMYPCVRARVDMRGAAISPTVDSVKVTWDAFPVFLISHSADAGVSVGESILYTINYSVSFADADDLVIWAELPSEAEGTVNYDVYDQNPDPGYKSATRGGIYSATEIDVRGVTVPANSVYWDLGDVHAGTTSTVTYVLKTNNGWADGILYESTAHIFSTSAEQLDSNAIQTTLNSSPNPLPPDKLDQPLGTYRIGGQNYVYIAGGDTVVSYQIRAENDYES